MTILVSLAVYKESRNMKYWLLKTEPEEWSWLQQRKSGKKGAEWNGVRNFQAAKDLKNIKTHIINIFIFSHFYI